jgi:hypothetical protein
MRLAFILLCVQGGLPLPVGGDMFFLDVYRCIEFGRSIEVSANRTWVGSQYAHEKKTDCECQPRFAPDKTKFWD